MAKDYLKKLRELEGAVTRTYNPFAHGIRTPSPSANFIFGKNHELPLGMMMALAGPPKGGKTYFCNMMIGQLHADDPDAIAIKMDTEFRENGQMTNEQAKIFGIDLDRYLAYSVNTPALVFDRIEKEIATMCEEGMPLKLLIIDSLTGIRGRRSLNADTIETQQIGDDAKTVGDGIKMILPILKKYNIASILTSHIRAEMDPLEQRRGNKVRMTLPWQVLHTCEYFAFIEADRTADGRKDANGLDFTDETKGDIFDNAETTGHKIKIKMKDSSIGPRGRVGEFTISYKNGIINTHEEVFLLGKNRGILVQPNNRTYVFGDKQWTSRDACLTAIKEDTELQKAILTELKKQDLAGKYADDESEG